MRRSSAVCAARSLHDPLFYGTRRPQDNRTGDRGKDVRMSEDHGHGISRRRFLHAGLAAAGGTVLLGSCRSLVESEQKHTRWAFASDTHIAADPENNYRGSYPYRNLQTTVEQITAEMPEGLIITGDLARLTGQTEDYRNLRNLLGPVTAQRPVCLAMGNHDDRANFLQAFEEPAADEQAVKGKHVVTVNAGPVRFMVLDSLLYVNKTPGLLGKAQRTWLESCLRESDDRPTILFFHHTLGDADGDLLDVLRLFEMVKSVGKVKAIVYGHSHVYGFSQFEGIHLINLPATAYSFRDDQPLGWVEARLTTRGGEFILHAVDGNRKVDGDTVRLRWRT